MSKIVKYCENCFNKQEEFIEYIKSTTGFSIEDINKYFSMCKKLDGVDFRNEQIRSIHSVCVIKSRAC